MFFLFAASRIAGRGLQETSLFVVRLFGTLNLHDQGWEDVFKRGNDNEREKKQSTPTTELTQHALDEVKHVLIVVAMICVAAVEREHGDGYLGGVPLLKERIGMSDSKVDKPVSQVNLIFARPGSTNPVRPWLPWGGEWSGAANG
jgi:hypothetical protein